MRGLLLSLLAVTTTAAAQNASSPNPYLLRLDHLVPGEHRCVLLQNTGAYHVEIDHGDRVRVYEGTIESDQVHDIEANLNSDELVNLAQQQIEEPLVVSRREELQLTAFRGDHWQDLIFASWDTEQAFKSVQALIHWLDQLHKLPHQELSEEAGKNNCLPPKAISLSRRGELEPGNGMPKIASVYSAPAQRAPTSTAQPRVLLRLHFFSFNAGIAYDRCTLVLDDGKFRSEDRSQKQGRPVIDDFRGGQITDSELEKLRAILDDPRLAKLDHRKPSKSGMSFFADVLELSILRQAGEQKLLLSSSFGQLNAAGAYTGDGSLHHADTLLKFLDDHVKNKNSEALPRNSRNGCTNAP